MISKKYYALFDVDGTVLKDTSMISFLKFFYQAKYRNRFVGSVAFHIYILKSKWWLLIGKNREYINEKYYYCFKDSNINWLKQLGQSWFDKAIACNADSINKNVLAEVKCHQQNDCEVVFVSGSFAPCLLPLARMLSVTHVLATDVVIKNDILTGQISFPQAIGEGKAQKVRKFFNDKNYKTLQNCFAYGDHDSDIALLSLVGNPVVIAGNKNLERYANNNGWKIIQPNN